MSTSSITGRSRQSPHAEAVRLAEIKRMAQLAENQHMLNRLPSQLPSLGLMLQDLGHPPARALAKSMGVTERTAKKWIIANRAPRPVMLALYWLTRWGMTTIDAETFNLNQMHAGLASTYKREVLRLESQIARMLKIGDFGSANDPTPEACEGRSAEPGRTRQPRQNPQAEPVTPAAFVRPGHLKKGPAFPSRP